MNWCKQGSILTPAQRLIQPNSLGMSGHRHGLLQDTGGGGGGASNAQGFLAKTNGFSGSSGNPVTSWLTPEWNNGETFSGGVWNPGEDGEFYWVSMAMWANAVGDASTELQHRFYQDGVILPSHAGRMYSEAQERHTVCYSTLIEAASASDYEIYLLATGTSRSGGDGWFSAHMISPTPSVGFVGRVGLGS